MIPGIIATKTKEEIWEDLFQITKVKAEYRASFAQGYFGTTSHLISEIWFNQDETDLKKNEMVEQELLTCLIKQTNKKQITMAILELIYNQNLPASESHLFLYNVLTTMSEGKLPAFENREMYTKIKTTIETLEHYYHSLSHDHCCNAFCQYEPE
ncbi:MAG: hypothetical protein V1707_02545 [bacterium]